MAMMDRPIAHLWTHTAHDQKCRMFVFHKRM
jgi:hypothetical protein